MKKQRARALVITPLGNAILRRILRGTYTFRPNNLGRPRKRKADNAPRR